MKTATARDMVSIWDCVEPSETGLNYWGFRFAESFIMSFENFSKIDSIVTEQSLEVTSSTTAYNLTKQGLNNVTSFETRNFLWELMTAPVIWSSTGVSEIEQSELVLESEANTLASRSQRRSSSRGGIPASSDTIIDPGAAGFVSELAINCVDSIDQPDITTQFLFETVVNVTQQISPLFGEVLIVQAPVFCHRFPTRAVERFTGPFNHTLAFPMLVVGNKADPVTPFQNAQNVANSLGESARLIQQDGFGRSVYYYAVLTDF
ncbi:hypothetical protein Clacol_004547 [Clathrus columnatus]|uniref:Peptidase S33 tripeptidyl aminopeptidase-like C-terminal domain-containing protein n=1 Tax=Clathrus columnatus TaxID=1419009 RepID=A0AAV5A6R2_9AGAM|nr:hypothetical protein Clacol_004547 [Clathrus columnatus]